MESIILKPIVSVVIPTFRRADLIKRSVISALSQTLKEIEVIVVIDGPHPETRAALTEIEDTRLKVIELPTNQGCFASRIAGIISASADWIAHLDDDDEWMPQKLEFQLAAARASRYQYPIVSCYLIARTSQRDEICPKKQPKESEPLSEYFFVRNNVLQGQGVIQASTIFTRKELFLQSNSLKKITKHEDWDWLLQVIGKQGVGIEFVPQALSIWHLEETHQSLSRNYSWESSFNWIQSRRDLVTPRAYSSFLLAEVNAKAARDRNFKGLFVLVSEAFRYGKPSLMDLLLCLGMWLFPSDIRGKLRSFFYQQRHFFSFSSESSAGIK